jgi:hypothetical protein
MPQVQTAPDRGDGRRSREQAVAACVVVSTFPEPLIQINARLTFSSGDVTAEGCMSAMRFLPPGREAAAETTASHAVMELVRKRSALSLLVVQLRDQGRSWRDVQAAIEAEIERTRPRQRGRVST